MNLLCIPAKREFRCGLKLGIVTRKLFICGSLLMCGMLAQAASGEGTDAPILSIQISGTVDRLSSYEVAQQLALYMARDTNRWHFVPDGAADASAPNRLVWSFKTSRLQWPGGSHKSFPAKTAKAECLSAEGKLFLNSDYQMTLRLDPMICNQTADALARMAHDAVVALLQERSGS